MDNKFVSKKCIEKFINYKMELQKKVNKYKAWALALIFLIGDGYAVYFLCKWNYSIINGKLCKIPYYLFSNESSILHKRDLSIYFTIATYPIIHFLSSIKGFGVFKIGTKQNKKSRILMEHLNWLFELDTSFSIALGVVNRDISTAIILLALLIIMIAVFVKNRKDTDKADFNCDKYIKEQQKKEYDYNSHFKKELILININNTVNISDKDLYNLTDNMFQ